MMQTVYAVEDYIFFFISRCLNTYYSYTLACITFSFSGGGVFSKRQYLCKSNCKHTPGCDTRPVRQFHYHNCIEFVIKVNEHFYMLLLSTKAVQLLEVVILTLVYL